MSQHKQYYTVSNGGSSNSGEQNPSKTTNHTPFTSLCLNLPPPAKRPRCSDDGPDDGYAAQQNQTIRCSDDDGYVAQQNRTTMYVNCRV